MVSHDLLRVPLGVAALLPAILFISAAFVTRRSPFGAATLVTSITAGLSVVAVALHAGIERFAPAEAGRRTLTRFGLVQLDLVSSAMLVLVGMLAIVVVRYSRRYLAGEAGLVRYARSLLLTLAAVNLLVISNHLGFLMAGWAATDIGLHQLLTFYAKRRQAIIVAHKKFLLGQVANLFFVASLWFVESDIESLHIDVINAYARTHGSLTPGLQLAMVFLVIGVLLKTAQLPFHGWILQVMEAPTPVSALLHAGVVNIGGFVMIRLSPFMLHATLAQGILLGVGLLTAIVGSLVMTTRPSIKVVLAWSTIAQMGFMLVQCGLGVWHLALLHLLAHSVYKAHAFLGSGSVVETWRGYSLVKPRSPSLGYVALAIVLLALTAAPFAALFAFTSLHASTSLSTFAVALALSFVPMLGRALAAGGKALALSARLTIGATASYFALHALVEELTPSLNVEAAAFKWAIVSGGIVVLFLAQTLLQASPTGWLARWLQPHLHSGLYIDDWFTRLTFRLWPPKLERRATVSRRSSVTLEAR